ncbi:MAG: hypothetical protein AB9846_08370 [Tenuifilaceae bacterium]
MENENPYISELDRYSDDELFEIIANQSETDNPSKYVAAISIALKRELISEYQSMELLEGNTSVLEYNPIIAEKDVEDYREEEKVRKEERRRGKLSKIQYGLMLIVFGLILLFLVLTGDLFFPTKTIVIGTISTIVGFVLVIIGYVEKIRKRRSRKS